LTTVDDALPQGQPAAGGTPGHETTEIGVRGLVVFSVALIGVIAAAQIVLGLWMRSFARQEKQVDARYPGRTSLEVGQFPNPRLQQNPRSDLDQVKDEEDRRIRSYGWVDRQAGIARIPIERAMDILARKGLPRVPAPATVPGAPPNTSIPPARKREEAGQGPDRGPPAAKPAAVRPESKRGGQP
jgi:hypothetical protein